MKILLATNNEHKVKEISEIMGPLKKLLVTTSELGEMPDPVEDGSSYRQNAVKKAMHYYHLTGLPTLADDSGIEIEAFDNEPGIYSSRYLGEDLTYEERNKKVLEKMKNVPEEKRSACFRCCCVLVLDENNIRTTYGVLEGRISTEPRGENGFGYDPIFYLPDRNLNLAELSQKEKNKISHRAQAFRKMAKEMKKLFKPKIHVTT
ncbi:MAG: RdgB/HAM1 family non-canonical purine NTP pyrophosphatase [Vulcanimicrobiota bacterium]